MNPQIANQLLDKLEKILKNPKIPKNKLNGSAKLDDLYKIKLKAAGYRLVYQVKDETVVVLVLDVDRRDTIYKNL